MEKKSKVFFIISLIVVGILSILIPLFIHIAFRAESPEGSFLIAEWGAGDMLSYCGSIIGSIIVVITVWYTLKTSNEETRKTIEASQKQFSIDLAINSFMEYADSFRYSKIDEIITYKNYPQIEQLLKERDSIEHLYISILEKKDKAYFYLDESEIEYLEKNTAKVQTALNLLNDMKQNTQDMINYSQKPGLEVVEKYEAKLKALSKINNDTFKELAFAINGANEELHIHLKKIINARLQI